MHTHKSTYNIMHSYLPQSGMHPNLPKPGYSSGLSHCPSPAREIYVNVCLQTHTCIYIDIYIYIFSMLMPTNTRMYIYIYIYIYIYTYTHTHTGICHTACSLHVKSMLMPTNTHMYIYIYTHRDLSHCPSPASQYMSACSFHVPSKSKSIMTVAVAVTVTVTVTVWLVI